MSDADKIQILQKLNDHKLMDVVKNYKQYGYSENLREEAIRLLEERGLSVEFLQMSGNFENKDYDYAEGLYHSFIRNSKIAIILLVGIFVVLGIAFFLLPEVTHYPATILGLIMLVGYFIFARRASSDYKTFYEVIDGGQSYGDNYMTQFFVGRDLLVFLNFYLKEDMRERLKGVR